MASRLDSLAEFSGPRAAPVLKVSRQWAVKLAIAAMGNEARRYVFDARLFELGIDDPYTRRCHGRRRELLAAIEVLRGLDASKE